MKRREGKNWDELLHSYLDGELDKSERKAFEAELENSSELRAQLEALREMSGLLRTQVEMAADEADFGSLWAGIEARMDASEAPSIDALQLQAFSDGQLTGKELSEVVSQVGNSKGAAEQLAAIGEMGDLLRAVVEPEVEAADYKQLWAALDAEIGGEIESRGALPPREESGPVPATPGAFQRLLAAIGGYRTMLASAATAAIVVLVLLPMMRGEGTETNKTQDLEIRVVHINEVRSDPGYAVTVDAFNDGNAPVIYIRPDTEQDDDESAPEGGEPDDLFDNPI